MNDVGFMSAQYLSPFNMRYILLALIVIIITIIICILHDNIFKDTLRIRLRRGGEIVFVAGLAITVLMISFMLYDGAINGMASMHILYISQALKLFFYTCCVTGYLLFIDLICDIVIWFKRRKQSEHNFGPDL